MLSLTFGVVYSRSNLKALSCNYLKHKCRTLLVRAKTIHNINVIKNIDHKLQKLTTFSTRIPFFRIIKIVTVKAIYISVRQLDNFRQF
ncbi:13668_t:CDS:2 [Funneliformis mosseae]|uniref:13668_t:CDS:1 n=1 Tax=Funneliformis mosseae TaxID=27381 RepID=A0A9N8YRJ9_FUNMO|nr:13668_t:CDS:2 [Funneliformis mosseae]